MSDTRSAYLKRLRETVLGSGSITDWLLVGKQVREMPGLPGDPGMLRSTAATLRNGGHSVDQVRVDLDKIRQDRLPTIWTGLSATAASSAVGALTVRSADINTVLGGSATVLDHLADGIEQARQKESGGRSAVDAAIALQAHLGPADYRRIQDAMVIGLDQLVAAARAHEDATLEAARLLRAHADRATASRLGTTSLTPLEKVVLAAAGDTAGPILTASDAEQAAKNMGAWDWSARLRLAQLLGECASDDERAWLLKAVAAGHSMDDVARFDGLLRPHATDEAWLTQHLRVLNPTQAGDVTFMNASMTQFDGTTCGTMCLLVNHAMRDPMYALQLSYIDPPVPPDEQKRIVGERLVEEQRRIHGESNNGVAFLDWPQGLGTHPDDAAQWLSDHSGGVQYGWHQDVISNDTTVDHVASTITAAGAGNPSMILIGDGYPDHYVMVVGETDSGVSVYNPATGRITQVPAGELAHENLGGFSNRSSIYVVITPK